MNEHNPYQSPAEIAAPATPGERDIPEDINSHIRQGWITACFSGALTLVASLATMASNSGGEDALFGAWSLIDVGLIAALAFGIYKRSRTAATIMFVYFALAKILIASSGGNPFSLVFGLLFLFFYFRAMTATYRYHRFLRDWQRNPPAPRQSLADNPAFNRSGPDQGVS